MKERILIIDDELSLLKALERFLKDLGYEVLTASTYDAALVQLSNGTIHAALIDLKLAEKSGIDLLKDIKKLQPHASCLMMTGYATVDSAIEAIKCGAFHYLTKPFRLEDVENLLKQALETEKVKQENQILKKQLESRDNVKKIVGLSEGMSEVYQLIDKVADTDSTILVLGESGTGKELVAKAIHYKSRRASKPLITVNCGAIPEELLESELFGHMKGAFTGAVATRPGRFQSADGGTIFLDEIGDMSLRLQVKLLRVLQEKRFEPVGSNKTVEVDVRIIAATNKDLEKAVAEGAFREDLYYRLHVIPIRIPALRERLSDIPLLAEYFLKQSLNSSSTLKLSAKSFNVLKSYAWPGNVRELENLIERLVILKKEGEILPEDLPTKFVQGGSGKLTTELIIPNEGVNLKELVEEFEDQLILQALERTDWNKNRAASLLKLNRTTLVEKIKKRGLDSGH